MLRDVSGGKPNEFPCVLRIYRTSSGFHLGYRFFLPVSAVPFSSFDVAQQRRPIFFFFYRSFSREQDAKSSTRRQYVSHKHIANLMNTNVDNIYFVKNHFLAHYPVELFCTLIRNFVKSQHYHFIQLLSDLFAFFYSIYIYIIKRINTCFFLSICS